MPKIPINIVLESENRTGGEIQRTLGLTNEQMSALNTHINRLVREQTSLDQSTSKLTATFKGLVQELRNVKMHVKGAFESLVAGGMMSGALKMVGQMNMQLYDLSKTARLTGQNFGEMRRGIEDITDKTRLSIVESTQFYKTVSEGTRGVRMAGDQVSKMAQTLSREFGPALDDVSKAFEKLAALQEKDIFLFRQLNESMSPEALTAYATRLVVVNKASQDQINTLFRLQIARTLEGTALTKEQLHLRSYNDTVQEFQKSLQNLTVSIGQPLLKIFNELREPVTKVLDGIASFVEKSPKLTLAIGGVAMFGPALMGLGNALGGIGRMAGGIGGGIGGVLGGIGRKKGQSPQDAIFVQPVGLGGLGGGAPGAGMGGPGMAGAPAGGRGWSAATRGRVAGYGAVAGIAGHVGGMIAEEAGAPTWASAGMKTLGNIGAGVGMGAMAGPWGALIGGIGGLAVSIPTLWDAFSGTEEATKKVTDAQKEQAEAVKASTEEIMKAEKQAGMGVGEAGFGAQYAMAQIMRRRLMQQGMGAEGAEEEIGAAARGAASSRYLALARGISGEEIKREMQGIDLAKLIGADRAREEMEKATKIAGLMKAQFEILTLQNLLMEAEQIKNVFDTINGSLKEQAALQAELFGDIKGSGELLNQALANRQISLQLAIQERDNAKAIIDAAGGYEQATIKIQELKKSGAALDAKQREELNKIQNAVGTISILEQNVVTHKRAIADLEKRRIDRFEPALQLQEQQLSLMESQAQMAKEMYLGAGPTLEFQIGQVQQLEKQKNMVVAQIKETQTLLRTRNLGDKERIDLQTKLAALQQKQVNLTTKQLSLTKNLREGYLEAMQTMTNAEGTFAKFVLRREMGMGELQRQFLAAGGLRAGMLGAGAAQHTMRWRPGGGPGALQFMSPQQLMQLGQGYGEEYGPMTMFPNVPAAMAATPLGQFGAQAPESGMLQLGGRAGQAITVPSGRLNQQQAAEMQAIQKRVMLKAEKGESTVAERTRAEEIRKEAAAGSFEGQVLQKMDNIIALMEGTRQVFDVKPDKGTQTAVREGAKEGAKAGAEAAEKKKQESQARDYTRRAQAMRRGTGMGEGPTSAEAAYKKEKEKLAESERIEQQRFQAYERRFADWDAAAAGVDTTGIGIGGRGGTRGRGVRGVRYAGAPGARGAPGAPMTTEGYAFDKPFTAEQVQAVSRRLGARATYGPEESKPQVKISPPDMDAFNRITQEMEKLKEVQLKSTEKSAKATEYATDIAKKQLLEVANPENPAAKSSESLKNELARVRKQQESAKKEDIELRRQTGGADVGWGTKVADELSGFKDMLGESVANLGSAAKYSARMAFRTEEGPTQEQIARDYEKEIFDREKNRKTEQKAQDQLLINQVRINALKKRETELLAEIKTSQEAEAKAVKDASFDAAQLARAREIAAEEQEKAAEAGKKLEALGKKRAAAEKEMAAYVEQRVAQGQKEAAKTLGMEAPEMAKRQAGIYTEGKRVISERQRRESEERMQKKVSELEKLEQSHREQAEFEQSKQRYGEAAESERAAERAAELARQEKQRHAEFLKGAEVRKSAAGGPGVKRMAESENEFAKWQKTAEGEKTRAELEKLRKTTEKGIDTQKEVGRDQVNAQKEAGQNLKSTLEQQKIDVSPVVTSVNPACATAVAQTRAAGGWIAAMAEGGRLPGFGGGDRVLALLEPGEFVVNKRAAAAFPGLLENVNRFQGGGMAGMAPSPSIARQGGTIAPSFNISVRGDTAKTLVGSVNKALSGVLNDMFAPQGTSGRLYDLGV